MAEHLKSWNDTPTRQAIVDFVGRVTEEGGAATSRSPSGSRCSITTARSGVTWDRQCRRVRHNRGPLVLAQAERHYCHRAPPSVVEIGRSTSLPEVVDDFCFDSLRQLLAAPSSRVEHADGRRGHDCPIRPIAEAGSSFVTPPETPPSSWKEKRRLECCRVACWRTASPILDGTVTLCADAGA